MKISRRKFAALLAGGALSAPFSRFLHRRAKGQSPEVPVRFLAIRSPQGADRDFWIPRMPTGGEPVSADMDLSELTFEYEHNMLAPLMPWRQKITVLDGLDTQVTQEGTRSGRSRGTHGHHEQGCLLTGSQPPVAEDGNYDGHPLARLLSPRPTWGARFAHGGTWIQRRPRGDEPR